MKDSRDEEVISEDGFRYEVSSESDLEETQDTDSKFQTPLDISTLQFLRNLLRALKLTSTLEQFEKECASMEGVRVEIDATMLLATGDIHLENARERVKTKQLSGKLQLLTRQVESLKASQAKLKKQRDHQKMLLGQVFQEKAKLEKDIIRVKRHCDSYEPTMDKLRSKYELLLKEKTLMRIDRDRIALQLSQLKDKQEKTSSEQGMEMKEAEGLLSDSHAAEIGSTCRHERNASFKKIKDSNWRSVVFSQTSCKCPSAESGVVVESESLTPAGMHLIGTIEAHQQAVSSVHFHPCKDFLVSAGDDRSLKIWKLPSTELVLTLSECHDSWISSAKFHPNPGSCYSCLLGSSGGDNTVKIWDLQSCAEESSEQVETSETPVSFQQIPLQVLRNHTAPVWDLDWCPFGTKLVTAGMDHTVKLFDCITFKNRLTFRGHVDSVNCCCFSPHNDSYVLSGSADKTISLWDARSGNCEVTLFGHEAAVQDIKLHPFKAYTVASCDLQGRVLVWDVRKVSLLQNYDSIFQTQNTSIASPEQTGLNAIAFDRQGEILAGASYDSAVKLFGVEETDGKLRKEVELLAHEATVTSVSFSVSNTYLASGGADKTVRVWRT